MNIYEIFPQLVKFKEDEKKRFIIVYIANDTLFYFFSNTSIEHQYLCSNVDCLYIAYRKSGIIFSEIYDTEFLKKIST